jgi:hypothetical protein
MASTAIGFTCSLAASVSAQDPSAAPGVVHSQKKVKLKLYGQIARQFGFVGDGESVTFKQGPNGNTSTRMGIDGRGKVTNDISLRTRMEFQVQSGSTGGGTQFENQGEPGTASRFTVRHLDVIISSKKFGAVWMGRGDTASNGTSEVDLGGMSSGRLGGSATNILSEYILMSENDSAVPQAVATVGRFFNAFDGTGRQNRIRYDTPTLFGFKAGVDFIDKHNVSAGARYKGKIAGTEIAAGAGWCHTRGGQSAGQGACFGNGTTVQAITQVNGSVSVKLPIGLGATFSGATQWRELAGAGHTTTANNPWNINPSVFYTAKFSELGSTTFEYAYQYSEDITAPGDEGQAHAVTALQRIDSVGGDYFVTFRYVDAETATNNNIEPLWFVGGGFRQRF